MGAFMQPGGRFGARNVSLRFLVRTAYDVKEFQINSGGFSWMGTDRYDITTKAPAGTAEGFLPLRPMLQALLADRFQLRIHRETKELPVFELVMARGGPRLSAPRDGSCAKPDPAHPRPRGEMRFCDNIHMQRGAIEAYGITMTRLVAVLSDVLVRYVIDRTGFDGIFDCHLQFAPDEAIADVIVGGGADSTGPSIFTVLQEQLGLRLESARGPVEMLVVDRAERPSAN